MSIELQQQPSRSAPRSSPRPNPSTRPRPTWVWGLPFSPLTSIQAVEAVGRLVEARTPSHLVSANLNYAMLSCRDPALRRFNETAALVLADGMPLVWASRGLDRPLPERVAGSDFLFDLADLAADRDFGVFLLGGAPGVGEQAAANLRRRCPGLRIVGVESPPFQPQPDAAQERALVERIRQARPDILLVAFGQPKGELWLARLAEELGVPVTFQVGASLDFAAGRVRRAPNWVRRTGLEWAFRLALEPRRLARRYASNALFLLEMVVRGGWGRVPSVSDRGGLGG